MMYLPFILLGLVLLLLIAELIAVRRIVENISIRVHVNGSRGKSSVTRYIAAGLRAGGKKTLGKITGIVPTMLLPDGTKQVIVRRGPANVREQLKLARLAASLSCDALVLECMSIAPSLQSVETKILKPHLTVLLNILEDHLEELGNTDPERTEAYCSSLPSGSIIVTNDTEHIWEIEKAARERNSRVIIPIQEETTAVRATLHPIAAEHLSIALTVCKTLGVDGQTALRGILDEMKNDESLFYSIPVNGGAVPFINGFAVNDTASAQAFMDSWKDRVGERKNLVIVLNTRSDRPNRSIEFARWCATEDAVSSVVVTGTHIPLTVKMLQRYGATNKRVTTWTDAQVQSLPSALHEFDARNTVLFGFGNIAGDGFAILKALGAYREHKEHAVDY